MADQWEEGSAAPKRGVPGWVLWGCGGGCLVVTLLVVVVAVLAGRVLHEALDSDKAWTEVAELLPHDERPAGWEAFGTTVFGFGIYVLRRDDAVIVVQRLRSREEAEALFDPDPVRGAPDWFADTMGNPERGTLVLQGREVPFLRFEGGFEAFRKDARRSEGSGIRVDVTGTGVPTVVHVAVEDGEPVSDERVNELLAPFDVWRGR